MAKTFLTTLNATSSPGPFNIYYNTISNNSLIAASPSNADKTSLLSGVYVTVPNDVQSIFLENTATGCGNIVEFYPIPSPTPTPTSTPSTSNTPSISVTPSVTPSISISITPSISVTPSITPSVTPSISISITPSISIIPSITLTPTPTPTTTCANNCYSYDIFISSTDLNASYNNTVVVDYYTCFGAGATGSISYNAAGTYVNAVCVDAFAIPTFVPDIYYYFPSASPGNKVTATASSGSINGFCCI